MPQAISAEQIQKAEQMLQARMQSDPAVSEKVRNGQIKWIVEPGDKISRLVAVDLSNPESVSKYGGIKMYNTPQEAEHFTEGFGNQPTRSGGVADILESRTMPRYQHQRHDPIRKYTKDPALDVLQDATATARYLTPLLPFGPAAVAGITAGLGTASKAAGALSGEEELQETWPNILATAATAGLAAKGNKYFSEEETRRRQLGQRVESQLGYGKRMPWQASPLEPELLPEIEKTLQGGNAYTIGDWRNAPLDRLYEKIGTRALPMTIDRLPMVHEPTAEINPDTKTYGTSAKIAPRNKPLKWNPQQWDAVARRYIQEAGLPPDTDPNDVRAFIEEAWSRPDSKYGNIFYAKGGTPAGFTTEQWAAVRATDKNPVAKELAATKGKVTDEKWDKLRAKALEDRKSRFDRMSTKGKNTAIVTPQQYEKFGSYDFKVPFMKLGNESVRLPIRPWVRAGATIAPVVAQALLPYAIKKWNTRRDDE